MKKINLKIDKNKLPVHIGIILDGNRRWAKLRSLPPMQGHKKGIENIKRILKFAKEIGIKIVSLYVFSTENWKRSKEEVSFLMNAVKNFFNENIKEFKKNGIKILHSGRTENIPTQTLKVIKKAVKITEKNNDFIVNICFNYGGRQEIIDGIKKLYQQKFDINSLNEENFSKFLYQPELPFPDLIIRTSGEIRTSNFLLWESAYSEWFFTKTFWPDFSENDLLKAIKNYQKRERRFGK